MEKSYSDRRFCFSYILFIIKIGGILVLFIYIYIYIYKTRLASNEIYSPSNKIHRVVCRAKDLSAPPCMLPNSRTSRLHKKREISVSIVQQAGFVSEPHWMRWSRAYSLLLPGVVPSRKARGPDHSSSSCDRGTPTGTPSTVYWYVALIKF